MLLLFCCCFFFFFFFFFFFWGGGGGRRKVCVCFSRPKPKSDGRANSIPVTAAFIHHWTVHPATFSDVSSETTGPNCLQNSSANYKICC